MTETPDSASAGPGAGGVFDAAFLARFEDLLAWRRDVRRFRTDPLPDDMLQRLLKAAHMAPSVGNSQPWRFVTVDEAARREAVRASFRRANREALASYSGETASLYATLKLEGLSRAPVQLAVFCDGETGQGAGLGRRTMPEMLAYSCVCAVNTLWLAARAQGVGLGWVSILEPETVADALDVPASWRLIAYLCMGYPAEEHLDPELERAGWQAGTGLDARWVRR
ncbi:5,6-dimethylbenzimidazole synthase [Stappia stellulata]|uniref:5,6-dimethylbenzimidazole synthase n=1 Tax=Stappia stellulata TaxID=71235 RepID=UPI000409E444|nr:5,6-dimethylbenzimidazole synthase [Stappia stellulata]